MSVVEIDQLTLALLAKHHPRTLVVPWWEGDPGLVRCARCLHNELSVHDYTRRGLRKIHSYTTTRESATTHCANCITPLVAINLGELP